MTKVLDHGYIELVETWGSDERIIEAARMSTNKGFQGWGGVEPCPECHSLNLLDPIDKLYRTYEELKVGLNCKTCKGSAKKPGDEKLLRFLWENKHHTPFEMPGATFEVMAPIMVFREWHRHRTQSYNEMSGRYTALPDLNYIPTVERLMINSKTNKQAGTVAGAEELTEEGAAWFRNVIDESYLDQELIYQEALRRGVPKELARVHLPVGRYSKMRASANLRNWIGFLVLRQAPNAQWEIRQYADALCDLLKEKFPRTMGLYLEKK